MSSAKCIAGLTLFLILAATTPRSCAQNEAITNPVSTSVKTQMARFNKNMVAAAESMPAEKYGFKPTPEMITFGHLIVHIASSNNMLCSKLSGTAAPDVKMDEADPKDKLVAALKASFDFCSTALANADDSKLGEQIALFGGNMMPRAVAWLALIGGWSDHYGQEAIYLRLNGILPPTAQPKK
jgi:hypothetical protein